MAKIESKFTVAGVDFSSAKDAKAYGVIVDQVDSWAANNGATEEEAMLILKAFRDGALTVPKATRKPRTKQ